MKTVRAIILLASLICVIGLCHPGRSIALQEERLVLAFYYTWFDENTWTPNMVPDMPVTPYVSRERDTIERHVAQAQEAGIDGFVTSWYGPQEEGNQTEMNFRTLLDVAQARGFYATVDFELTSPFYASQADVVAALRYLLETHVQHPAFLRYRGKPVIFFWRQQTYDVSTWATLRQQVDPAHTTLWIAEGVDLSFQDVFDGHHLYNITWNPPTDPAYTAAKFRRKIDEYNASHGTQKLWIATTMPGYDDTHVSGRQGTYVHPRRNGAYYRQTWEAAMTSRPSMIVINSFNEWREGTMIEPSLTYGDLYLNLTAELAVTFKAGSPTDTATPVRLPTGTPAASPWATPRTEQGQGHEESTIEPATPTETPTVTATFTETPSATATPTSTPLSTPTAAPPATRPLTLAPTPTMTQTPPPAPAVTTAPGPDEPFVCSSLLAVAVLPLVALLRHRN